MSNSTARFVRDSAREPVTPDQPRIVAVRVAAGHDGQAELVVQVKFENGATGSVTLNALFAQKLMEDCQVDSAEELIGQSCQRLFDLMPD